MLFDRKIITTPIPCFRKYCLYKILIPCLVKVGYLYYNKCFDILNEWLKNCNNLYQISFDIETEINERLMQ